MNIQTPPEENIQNPPQSKIDIEDVLISIGIISLGIGLGFALGWYWGLAAAGAILTGLGFWLLHLASRFPPRGGK